MLKLSSTKFITNIGVELLKNTMSYSYKLFYQSDIDLEYSRSLVEKINSINVNNNIKTKEIIDECEINFDFWVDVGVEYDRLQREIERELDDILKNQKKTKIIYDNY